MKTRWSAQAKADLREVGRYIAQDKSAAGRAWVRRLRDRANHAGELPQLGRVVPEFDRLDVREVFLRTYRIIYRVADRWIVIIAVLDGRRQLGSINPDVSA